MHMYERRARSPDYARIFNEEFWVIWKKRTKTLWASRQERKMPYIHVGKLL